MSLKTMVPSAVMRALLGLPPTLQRRLAGGEPVEVEGRTLAPAAQLMIALHNLRGEPDLATLTPEASRQFARANASMIASQGPEMRQIWPRTFEGPGGPIETRLYVPRGAADVGPLLLYFHGGGFVEGDLDTHEPMCRFFSDKSGIRLLSTTYRLAPEHTFPAAVDDARAALDWAHANAPRLGADPERIGVGGDSSGANIAAAVAQEATRHRGPLVAAQFLMYPLLDVYRKTRSFEVFGRDYGLTEARYDWYVDQYVPDHDARSDPRASPLLADDLAGMPPAFIATAGFDILHDEGEDYARRLSEAGVDVIYRCYEEHFHGFARFYEVMPSARVAVEEAASSLRKILS